MADALLALATITGALVYLYADWQLTALSFGDPLGPKAFPALIGLGLLASGVLLLIETVQKTASRQPRAQGAAERRQPIVLAGMLVWTIVYYAAFEPVGYVVATAIYLLGLLAFFNRRRPIVNLAVALGFTAAAYLVFQRLLGVPMPAGLLAAL